MSSGEPHHPSDPGRLVDHPRGSPPGAAPTPDEAADDSARLFTSADFLSLDPRVEAAISRRIDLYYNAPLDIFPYGERVKKPHRFHVLYMDQVEERFPDDARMRKDIGAYGRLIFRWLLTYMLGKRIMQAVALAALWVLAILGAWLLRGVMPGEALQAIGAGLAMLAVVGVFVGVNAIVFQQYRLGLENRSYSLSREIIQYTRALQNDYTTIRALPDQSETHFQSDGPAWGRRSAFLVRLLMWIAARMEYLEKYIQVSMWRVRRERYWMDWAGGFLTLVVLALWAAALVLFPGPREGQVVFRSLQGLALALGLGVSWASFFRWRTPATLVQDKLDPESWIRYSTLDLDDTVGEQIRRDKERLVEYRNLTRGR
jgi:hypothetical protein